MVNDSNDPVDKQEEINEDSPWYYFYSIGCGFCKKIEPIIDELNEEGNDILKLDLTEPDNQKLLNELQKEYNKKCGTPWLINADTGEDICGFREKNIIQKWLDGENIPKPPRIKSPMPKLPFHDASNYLLCLVLLSLLSCLAH